MNEKELDRLLSLEDEIEETAVTDVHIPDGKQSEMDDRSVNSDISYVKKMKKTVDKRINSKVFRGIFLTVLVTAVFLVGVSLLFDVSFYNPTKPSRYTNEVDADQYMVHSDFHFLMDIYTGLHFTGKKYYPLEDSSKKEGFGAYRLYAKIQDVYESMSIDGYYNTIFEIRQGRFSIESLTNNVIMTRYIGDFFNDGKSDEYNEYIADMLDMDEQRMNEIKKLPESAVIYATISFEKSLSLEDTLKFIRSYPGSDFRWIAMDSDVQFMKDTYDGISLSATLGYGLTEEAKEKYPYLMLGYLEEDTTAEQLAECYLSRLQIMYDNPEFLKVVEHESSFYTSDHARRKRAQLEDRFAEMEEKGLWSIGLYGQITKEDFLTMVERGEIKYANIKDAKLSVLSR